MLFYCFHQPYTLILQGPSSPPHTLRPALLVPLILRNDCGIPVQWECYSVVSNMLGEGKGGTYWFLCRKGEEKRKDTRDK
jgi:hypothetical protein